MSSFLANYNQYRDKIYNYFLYRVGFDRETAEDLTSEVFLKAFDNYESYDIARPFQSWIYRIAHNHLVNHYRDTKPDLSIEALEEMNFQIADNKYADKLFNQLDHQILIKRLEEIPRGQAEIIMYRHVDQLEYTEIAEITGRDEGALRVSHHRAMENFRKILNT